MTKNGSIGFGACHDGQEIANPRSGCTAEESSRGLKGGSGAFLIGGLGIGLFWADAMHGRLIDMLRYHPSTGDLGRVSWLLTDVDSLCTVLLHLEITQKRNIAFQDRDLQWPTSMSRLFQPLALGTIRLEHRVSMAPLTRYRMDDDWNATHLSKEYYEQRACVPGTLIISEATIISRSSAGCHNAPGIWSNSQIAAWKKITAAVHRKGCAIYCQLWHQGRAAHPNVLESQGFKLLSSSAVPISPQEQTPDAMSEDEILQAIADYATAARNAIAAGFDGVEIHGANGYLPDQFLQTTCNKRADRWGGSIENRVRFHLEVTKAVIAAVGSGRTAMRLSPYSDFNGMLMSEPEATFEYLIAQLKGLSLSYLHLIEARIKGNDDAECGGQKSVSWMVKQWDHTSPIVLAGGFKPMSAREATDETYKDYDVIIAFGRYFVANPDLVYRIREGVSLTEYDRAVFYTPKAPKGYIDYPNCQQYLQAIGQA